MVKAKTPVTWTFDLDQLNNPLHRLGAHGLYRFLQHGSGSERFRTAFDAATRAGLRWKVAGNVITLTNVTVEGLNAFLNYQWGDFRDGLSLNPGYPEDPIDLTLDFKEKGDFPSLSPGQRARFMFHDANNGNPGIFSGSERTKRRCFSLDPWKRYLEAEEALKKHHDSLVKYHWALQNGKDPGKMPRFSWPKTEDLPQAFTRNGDLPTPSDLANAEAWWGLGTDVYKKGKRTAVTTFNVVKLFNEGVALHDSPNAEALTPQQLTEKFPFLAIRDSSGKAMEPEAIVDTFNRGGDLYDPGGRVTPSPNIPALYTKDTGKKGSVQVVGPKEIQSTSKVLGKKMGQAWDRLTSLSGMQGYPKVTPYFRSNPVPFKDLGKRKAVGMVHPSLSKWNNLDVSLTAKEWFLLSFSCLAYLYAGVKIPAGSEKVSPKYDSKHLAIGVDEASFEEADAIHEHWYTRGVPEGRFGFNGTPQAALWQFVMRAYERAGGESTNRVFPVIVGTNSYLANFMDYPASLRSLLHTTQISEKENATRTWTIMERLSLLRTGYSNTALDTILENISCGKKWHYGLGGVTGVDLGLSSHQHQYQIFKAPLVKTLSGESMPQHDIEMEISIMRSMARTLHAIACEIAKSRGEKDPNMKIAKSRGEKDPNMKMAYEKVILILRHTRTRGKVLTALADIPALAGPGRTFLGKEQVEYLMGLRPQEVQDLLTAGCHFYAGTRQNEDATSSDEGDENRIDDGERSTLPDTDLYDDDFLATSHRT